MADQLYAKGKEAFLSGDLALLTDTIKAVLVDTDVYTPNFATDNALDDVTGVVSTSGSFANKSVTGGVFDADPSTFTAVTGNESEAIVIYQDTGVASTSILIAYIDSATGLPVTPNGTDIIVNWSDGANKIFAL